MVEYCRRPASDGRCLASQSVVIPISLSFLISDGSCPHFTVGRIRKTGSGLMVLGHLLVSLWRT